MCQQSWRTSGAKAAVWDPHLELLQPRAAWVAETEPPKWPPSREPQKAAKQPALTRNTTETFVSETNNTEGMRHLNIVTPQLLIAMLGEEQLRHMWARLGPRDAHGNGNSCHGDNKERQTKGITNMQESKGAWSWIMQGDATTAPVLLLSTGRTEKLSLYHFLSFVAAGGQLLCYWHLNLTKKPKPNKNKILQPNKLINTTQQKTSAAVKE